MENTHSIGLAGFILFTSSVLPPLASAATVHIGECKTQYSSAPPIGVSTIDQASSYTVDLSNVTGLTAGIPIRINCTPDNSFFWIGEYTADTGSLTKQWTVDTEITVGGTVSTFTDTWSTGPVPYVNPGNTSSEVGYSFGPSPVTRSITVPWGTDLSQLSFKIRDRSSISGTNGKFYQSSMKVSGATFTTSSIDAPEIAVETSLGSNLETAAPVDFSFTVPTDPVTLEFVIKNTGPVNLELPPFSLTQPSDFSFTGPVITSVPGAGSTTFTVTFTPTAGGTRTATLEIPCNDPDEPIFTLQLSGTGLIFTADADLDGLNDAAEFNLRNLGFNWQVAQPALVTTLLTHANGAGLFTTSQVQTLHSGTPLIARNPATGKVKLTMDWKKSTSLSGFADFPASPAQVSVNSSGDIELEFTPLDDAAFFRLQSN